MTYCANCGSPVSEGENFCPICGTEMVPKLTQLPLPSFSSKDYSAKPRDQIPYKKGPVIFKVNFPFIAGIIITIAFVLILIFMFALPWMICEDEGYNDQGDKVTYSLYVDEEGEIYDIENEDATNRNVGEKLENKERTEFFESRANLSLIGSILGIIFGVALASCSGIFFRKEKSF